MVVRITTSKSKSDSTATVRVEGNLCWDDLSQLASEVRSLEKEVVLDLSGLRSADAAAICALQELIAEGAVPQGASLYIAGLLEAED